MPKDDDASVKNYCEMATMVPLVQFRREWEYSAVEREFPMDQIDVFNARAVEEKRQELLEDAIKEYAADGQSCEGVLNLIRSANRVVFFPIKHLLKNEDDQEAADTRKWALKRREYMR